MIKDLVLHVFKAADICSRLLTLFGLLLALRSSLWLFVMVIPLPPLSFVFGFVDLVWDVDLADLTINVLNHLSNCKGVPDDAICKLIGK